MAGHHHGVSTSTTTTPSSMQQRIKSSHDTTPATRPKIKIIHIVAPEVIKTDVANFRDLVQRLTGKQPVAAAVVAGASCSSSSVDTSLSVKEDVKQTTVVKKRPSPPAAEQPVATTPAEMTSDFLVQRQEPMSKKRKIKCEVVKVEEEGGFGDYGGLDCNDLWMDLNPGAGSFLSFLEEELNAFQFQGLAAADHDFLQPPLGGPARMDLVGEMYAS